MVGLAGRSSAVVAIPDAARAFVAAGLTQLSARHPVVIVTPTASDAERLAHDLTAFLGEDAVDTFPAWETLPFERVSPSAETMGRRLRTMWRLKAGGDRAPRIVVTPGRGPIPRPGPPLEDVQPVAVHPGDRPGPGELLAPPGP